MDVKRLTRVISDRWVVVLTGAIVGLIGALLFLNFASTGSSVYEATAPLRFDPAEGQTAQALAEELQLAREFAVSVAEEQLVADPTSQITVDLGEGRLLFISQASTQEQAIEDAMALRDEYLQADPDAGVGIDERMEQLLEEARQIDEEVDALQPVLTPEQQALAQEQNLLDQTILAVEERLRLIVLDEAAAQDTETRGALAAERARLEASLEQLRAERAALGEAPVAEMTPDEALRFQALQARQELLNAEYQRLYLRSEGVAGRGVSETPEIQDFASEPIDPILLAGVGLLGGAFIAVLGLMMVSRTRRIAWLPEDIEVPVLGQIPARPVEVRGNEAWYDSAEGGPRKIAVQALRSAVQAHAHSSGSTISLTGHNIASEDVQALAADLAGSMATAGDSVLLIDANFESRTALGEYRVAGLSLADVLRLRPETPEFNASIDAAVEQAYVVRPGLAVIPSGPPPGSPADALAGRQYRSLIAAAGRHYDTVIVVVDEFGTPSAQVAMQRGNHGIVVTSPGSTTETEINGLIDDAERLRISIVGAVFLGRRSRWSGLFRKSQPEPKQTRQDSSQVRVDMDEDGSPMNRLNNYAIPDERRSALVQHSPLGELATSFGLSNETAAEPSGLGSELLGAMHGTSRERAHDAVAQYVVSRAEDMATARYGYGDLPEDLIQDVSDYGFLSLRPVRNHRTVGSWLTEEIEREVEWDAGAEVVGELESLLTGGHSNDTMDDWLDQEFLARHLNRTDGEPEVWHLVSPERSVSLLLPARRLNAEKLESVITEVVSGGIDELERKRKAAVTRSDLEAAALYEQMVWDVQTFEKRISNVLYGSRGNGRRVKSVVWSPNWSDGTRANLAPFQREGLLPFDVLTEEEMSALSATA